MVFDTEQIKKEIVLNKTIQQYLEKEAMFLSENVIDNRLKLKKINGEKINVVFICHRPEVWNSLKTVYEAFAKDKLFNTYIIAVPIKNHKEGIGYAHEIYESEGAEEFWQEYNCINGYDYEKKEWFDLRNLSPDYIFYQQPYNVYFPKPYKSWITSKYAKICYVPYAFPIGGEEIFDCSHPDDFLRNVTWFFVIEKFLSNEIKNDFRKKNNYYTRVEYTGFPRMDLLSDEKKSVNEDKFCALWLPRWSTREGNCSFFDYKDNLLDYCEENKKFQLIYRPHPQAYREFQTTGEFSYVEQMEYEARFDQLENASIDVERDYLNAFKQSDCLIADMTSLLGEYFYTEKPIIYCYKRDCFLEVANELSKGYYFVKNWEELSNALQMLQKGCDPLREKRLQIKENIFGKLKIGNVGENIKNVIEKDALK